MASSFQCAGSRGPRGSALLYPTQPDPDAAHALIAHPPPPQLLGFPGQLLLWGAVEPAGACFISGLPGGLTYFFLGMCKIGLMPAMSEKRWTANLNIWLRCPGILCCSFVIWQAMLYQRHALPLWAPCVHIALAPYNALYYCKQAIANYTVHYMNALLSQDAALHERLTELTNSKTLVIPAGGQSATHVLASWKEALTVPQRGS